MITITSEFAVDGDTLFQGERLVIKRKNWRIVIQWRGKKWEQSRSEHVAKIHGMTWDELQEDARKNPRKYAARLIPRQQ